MPARRLKGADTHSIVRLGDAVLQQLTADISKHVSRHDCFARWGGEGFMILLTHSAGDKAGRFAEHLRIGIEKLLIRGHDKIACSFGVAQLSDGDDLFSLTKRADEALYRAKEAGRNRLEIL